MNAATADALTALNRLFYTRHAEAFSVTRQSPWPGWERLLAPLRARGGSGAPLQVLDVGCGNGRFAGFLAERLGLPFRFHGVDASEPLLARARRNALPGARWSCLDALDPASELPTGPFDVVVLFGVIHGTPGRERRRSLLCDAGARLAPGGLLVFTLWRFASDARARRRFVDWNAYSSRAPMPIDCSQLEPGDHLLPWGDGDEVLRYCHACDESEIGEVLDALGARGLELEARFRADGASGDRNDYLLLRRR